MFPRTPPCNHATAFQVEYHFQKPEEMDGTSLDAIYHLVREAGGVGPSWIREMLQNAFLLGYATHGDAVIGASAHKFPKEAYRKKIEKATGLDLSGYLERGYTAVKEHFRGQGIGGKLIRGLIERSEGKKIYVTIRMDNPFPLKMTFREGMTLSATFINDRTGHELGVFTNVPPLPAS